ncbi:hypothetical protein NPIL_271861 [Nephila pilipes]|uniref:Uncharacterized protein n=1 Tax=Nephila pilipes TaxID=299642 RepID=A0A8X6P566_NEPPI|nr:hypothetical protein NPIL_271861 [Nephila pilipes]
MFIKFFFGVTIFNNEVMLSVKDFCSNQDCCCLGTTSDEWNYEPLENNAANFASRHMDPPKMKTSELWSRLSDEREAPQKRDP